MDPRERNEAANKFRKEADEFGIGSPYRIKEYVDLRIRGWSKEKAINKCRNKPPTNQGEEQ